VVPQDWGDLAEFGPSASNLELFMRNEVLDFWFDPRNRGHWFQASVNFDRTVREHFLGRHIDAAHGRLAAWSETPDEALALCILLDQVPRNIFRGTAQAFATDPLARATAQQILARGFDQIYPMDDHRLFCYLPFEHSEDIDDQRLSVYLFRERTRNADYNEYARRHLAIIEQFGRFPHRNAIVGRASTQEEMEFLNSTRSSF
jgi:uncharacterized protein (DUF924 family)